MSIDNLFDAVVVALCLPLNIDQFNTSTCFKRIKDTDTHTDKYSNGIKPISTVKQAIDNIEPKYLCSVFKDQLDGEAKTLADKKCQQK